LIGIVSDSNAQIPEEVIASHHIEVVPLTVTIDGVEYLEGVDIDADGFYARYRPRSARPEVSTSQPSPGRFAAAYRALAERGATEALSVHIGSKVSGTVNAARLAAEGAPFPVHIVDTGTASFGVAFAAWEAAEAVRRGASLQQAARRAEEVASLMGNVFVVRTLDLARAGGRLAVDVADVAAVPVLSMVDGVMTTVGTADSLDDAVAVISGHICSSGTELRVAVGVADSSASPLWQALEHSLGQAPEVSELLRYRIGPTSAAHTGPGTFSAYYYPGRRSPHPVAR